MLILPKIDFLSIVLRGGARLYQKYDNPHIAQKWETSLISSDAVSSFATIDGSPEPMSVDVMLMVQIPFGLASANNNSYFSLIQDDFAKYTKIRVIQSTNSGISNEIAVQPNSWIVPGGL